VSTESLWAWQSTKHDEKPIAMDSPYATNESAIGAAIQRTKRGGRRHGRSIVSSTAAFIVASSTCIYCS